MDGMRFEVRPEWQDFFADDKGRKLLDHLREAVPTYFAMRSTKIKPVRGSGDQLFDMRIKKGDKSYRMGFSHQGEVLTCEHISKTICKRFFDAEAVKAVKARNSGAAVKQHTLFD